MRGTTGHTQPKVVVSGVTFPCWKKIWKKLRYNLILSRDIVIWLEKRHTWLHPEKVGGLRCYFTSMIFSMHKNEHQLIPSRDNDDHILQYDWLRDTTGHIQPKLLLPGATFPWWLTIRTKTNISTDFFRNTDDQRNLQRDWPHSTKNGSLRCCLPFMIIFMQKNWVI